MNLFQFLERTARLHPERPALYHGEELICDYRGFAARAAAIGSHLRERLGLQSGERVALFMANCTEYLEIMYGAWCAGLSVVPINAKLHPKEAEFILGSSAASVLFVSEALAGNLQPLLGNLPVLRAVLMPGSAAFRALYREPPLRPVPRAADDLAWLFYTSGTTGRPKGAMLTHRNLTTMIACHFISVDSTSAEDCIIYAAPMSHGAGMGSFAGVIAGARHVVTREGFEPAEVQVLSALHRRVFMFAAPTMVKRLADYIETSGTDPSGLRTILYGGGPMYLEDIKQALQVIGEDRFVQAYGQGETPMTITLLERAQFGDRSHPRYEARLASVGVAQSLVEVRVTDAQGGDLPQGEVGEILVRGDTVMRGYWDNPEATAKALRDGWLYTGDMGVFDADGFLTLKDRSKDMIISGGSNIYPREIEEVLLQHAGVHEVSVVGRRHAEWGEEVVAFVVAKPGVRLSERELDATCLQHIARFKRPRAYRFIDALPKSNYGKVLKTELREWLAREGAAESKAGE